MDLDKIKKLVGSIKKSVEDNEKLATPLLSAKLSKCLEDHPHDQTIGMMANIISKMSANNTIFIKRSELKSLYNKLYSRNTKFAELFADELGTVEQLATPTMATRDDSKELNPYEIGDSVLSNALSSVFDNSIPVKMYSQALATKALESVKLTLNAWNLNPNRLEVSAGDEKFLVIRADYETPKGITSFYVPVETDKNKVVEASVFMGNTGPQDLNHTNIKTYLTTNASAKLKFDASNVLTALTKAASENREVSGAELALIRFNSDKQTNSEFFQGQIVGQKIAEASQKEVNLPKSSEFDSFEKQFTSPHGQAYWQFGNNVNIAMNHIVRELTSFGHKNPQITVSKTDDNTIFYSVSLDSGQVGFVVPVKVANGKIVRPSLMLCNGSLSSFNKDGINELYTNDVSDFRAVATTSPLYDLKPSDVLNNLRSALSEGNREKAEDALNVLAHSGDGKAHATGFQLFMRSLSAKDSKSETKCSHMIKSASSQHPVCSHTGLPVTKVYQDKEGNCRPLYRRGMEETYEAAVFNNSKIFG